jgi:hypothetical protein
MQKALTVFIPDDLHTAVKIAATTAGLSIREFVTQVLAASTNHEESQNGSEKVGSEKVAPQKPARQQKRETR